jgi:hypothetical protein
MLGNAQGRTMDMSRLQRVFRLCQVTRSVRRHGQIRPYNFGVHVDRELWGHTVAVLIYDDMLRIERAEHLLVTYHCCYDTRHSVAYALISPSAVATPGLAGTAT